MSQKMLAPEVVEDLGEDPALEGDLNPDEWLARDDSNVTGHVLVRGGRLKVAALTQAEFELQRKASMRPQAPSMKLALDPTMMAKRIICASLNKANGGAVMPEQLGAKLTGDLNAIQDRILHLSGLGGEDADAAIPFD